MNPNDPTGAALGGGAHGRMVGKAATATEESTGSAIKYDSLSRSPDHPEECGDFREAIGRGQLESRETRLGS